MYMVQKISVQIAETRASLPGYTKCVERQGITNDLVVLMQNNILSITAENCLTVVERYSQVN